MIRERIKEAAQKYVGFIGVEDKITLKDAFKIGAEWALANQWYEIDEELPPIDEDCLFIFFNGRKNVVGMGYMREDKSVRLEGEFLTLKSLIIGTRYHNSRN